MHLSDDLRRRRLRFGDALNRLDVVHRPDSKAQPCTELDALERIVHEAWLVHRGWKLHQPRWRDVPTDRVFGAPPFFHWVTTHAVGGHVIPAEPRGNR